MARPSLYTIHFSRACPHGIMLADDGTGRPVKGSLRLREYNEDDAKKAAQHILDSWCVVDRVELANQCQRTPDRGRLVCARCLGTGRITYGNGTSEDCACQRGEPVFAVDPAKLPE